MIRNQCVNDGTAESGQEERNADTLVNFIEGAGLDVGVYDAAPGRRSMVARIEGSDPSCSESLPDGTYRCGASEPRWLES